MTTKIRTLIESGVVSAGFKIAVGPQAGLVAVNIATDGRVQNFAFIRYVNRASPTDHTALATMMISGQCVWAAIVYAEREGSEIAGWVDAFHVSEMDQLVSHLIGLRRALAEPVGVGGPL